MNKLKKFLITGLALCTAGCSAAGFAACTDLSEFPDFRRPADYVEPTPGNGDFKGDYTITVMTAGGLRISEVKLEVKTPDKTYPLTSLENGECSFSAEPGEYEITVDESTLPNGYFIGNQKFKTSATDGKAVVTVNSKVMSQTAPSSYRYTQGDVMYDFSYKSNDGNTYTLSEMLAEDSQYKAVVLNFWYISCNPCRSEFPALQSAYENYKDSIKLIAVSTNDKQSSIDAFKQENGYTFDMVEDLTRYLPDLFNVTEAPTTVIIDRYGVYVERETGAIPDSRAWSTKFAKYVSDNYVQTPVENKPGSGDPTTPTIVKPDVEEDDYSKFPALINGEGADNKVIEYYGASSENDREYNWPWISDPGTALGRPYLKTTNAKHGNSFSILTVRISLAAGDYISYDYFTDTEAGMDILYVIIDNTLYAEHSGSTAEGNKDPYGWVTNRAVYTASRNTTVSISFCYYKDELEDAGSDFVAISNICVGNVKDASEAIDMKIDACSGELDKTTGKCTEYVTPYFNESDNYYHVKTDNNTDSILFMDMINPTAWAELHLGGTTFKPINYDSEQTACLYYLIYWDHTNWKLDEDLKLTIGGADQERFTQSYIISYYMNTFSESKLTPVTKDLKELTEAFLKEYCRIENIKYYDEMWLEFCYYYAHFGAAHASGESCSAVTDPTRGMDYINAFPAALGNNSIEIWNIHTIDGGGMMAKFVPEKTGVYKFTSFNSQEGDDPSIVIYNSKHNKIKDLDNLVCYDLFLRPNTDDFEGYCVLNAGETYYLRIRKGLQTLGTVNYNIEFVGSSYDELRVASTGDGTWTYNEDTGIAYAYYGAIDTYLYEGDNNYYHIDRNGNRKSVVYIDFVHPNYYESNNHSLYWIIDGGYFNFTSYGGPDMTAKMLEFYNKAIDKDENDETYGMIEASRELVNLIATFLEVRDGEKFETRYWLSFATYYEHYGI